MMKTKKRRVNSFKNWLLARDSASRISTYPKYHSFLENTQSLNRDRSQIMDLFDSVTESKPFYKFNQIMNPGWAKDANQGKITVWIKNRDLREGILDFMECFNIPSFDSVWIKIELSNDGQETKIGQGETEDENKKAKFIYAHIPSSFDDRKIVSESKKAIEYWINNIDFKDELASNFFKWWMQNYIFVQEKYSNFLKSFESAFVEWLRTISPDEAGEAYLRIINNSKDTSIKRRRTDLGTKEIIDHINQGIKEFNIPIGDVKKGSSLLRRFEDL